MIAFLLLFVLKAFKDKQVEVYGCAENVDEFKLQPNYSYWKISKVG